MYFWVMPTNSSVVMTLPCLAEMATRMFWDRLTALVIFFHSMLKAP